MASIIAISLYMELPRLAFQAERQKEQMLMERGEQYKRAIGLFLRTNKNTRWPASIEELESYNNHRSLRRRYIDPLTGKDEWRLIHIMNGVLTDSLTNKKPNSTDQAGLVPTGFISELQGVGSAASTGSQNVNPGLRRRPSDGGPTISPDGQPLPPAPTGSGADPNAPPPPPPGSTPPANGGVIPGANGPPGGIAGLMGIPTTGQSGGQTNGQNSGVGTYSGLSGGGFSSQPTVPGATPPGFPGGTAIPGAQGNGQAGGMQINPTAQAAAAGLLQNLLTQPRPGGLQGVSSTASAQTGPIGGGIAGVASKAEGDSIMVYGDKTDFSEWEFIYDPMKFRVPNPNTNGATGIGTPVSQIGSTAGMSNPGVPIGNGPGGTSVPIPLGAGPGGTSISPPLSPGAFGASSGFGGSASPGASGTATSGFGSTGQSGFPGSSGSSSAGGSAPATGGGTAFGQAGLPDIRPGKK